MRETRKQHRAKVTILFVILIALLAQLLSIQIAHGAERFISSESGGAVTIEMRGEATIVGTEIRLKQIVRWTTSDNESMQPIGELIVSRLSAEERFKSIGLSELRGLLTQAGVNIAPINFTGPTACTITRSDIQLPQGAANQQLNEVEKQPDTTSKVIFQGPVARANETNPVAEESSNKSLRALLCENLATKLKIPVESLQVDFKIEDEGKLRLTEAQCKFDIEPQRTGVLGNVSWQVKTSMNGNNTRAFISATARAWQDQLILTRPLSTKQLITENDVEVRRSLVDRLIEDSALKKEQVVGQVASRDLKPGTVMTGRLVDSAPLVKAGQFVTIEHESGAVKIRVVARALDAGVYGQMIRVMNETTREISRVTVSGPQQATMGAAAGGSQADNAATKISTSKTES